jgi:preprotein translocase subunit SecB
VGYEIEEKYSFRSHGENVFEVRASYKIQGSNPMDRRKQLFLFATDIIGVYKSNRQPEEEELEKFIPSVKINLWPYLREQIHNLTSRLDMPPLIIPPFKRFGSEVKEN